MKLSSAQRAILREMRDGWHLRYDSAADRFWIYDPFGGRYRVNARAVTALENAGMIEFGAPYTLTPTGREALEQEP